MIEEFPNQKREARQSGVMGRAFVLIAAFGLGAGVMGIGLWQSGWSPLRPPPPAPLAPAAPSPDALTTARVITLETRLAQIDADSRAAAAQAGRAEALLTAFATRRAIESGKPLAYLEGHLRLRFAEALPHVVNDIITFARNPVTQDRLATQLEVLAPQLAGSDDQTSWNKIKHDLSGLFVIHSTSTMNSPSPKMRLDHARLCLKEGKIEDAIADVRLLPGAKAAAHWIADAQRYATAMHGLDAIDTAALLEPKLLHDGTGKPIEQASPVAKSPGSAL
jgi:hypothetical protein